MSSLYIDRRGVELEVDGEALVFRENGSRIGTVPLAPLSRVFLRGDVRLQSSLLGKLGAYGIGVIVLSGRKSEPTLFMARPHNDASKRIAQYRMSLDKEACLIFSKELVKKKLSHQYDFLSTRRELDLNHRYEITVALRKLEAIRNVIHEKESIPSLMGLEGAAAAGYFQAISVIAPPRLGFSHRNRRPPRDPLNAILSLGYTLLHAEAVLAIYGFGLDPFIGFYHQLDFSRESLACDLSELFRVEIDGFSLDLFRKDILRVEDFSTTNSGCLLGKNGRAKYYKEWEIFAEKFRKKLNESINEISDGFLNPI